MKRLPFTLLFLATAALVACDVPGRKTTVLSTSGTSGDCKWRLVDTAGNCTLVISGSGATGLIPLNHPRARSVIIGDSITTISGYAFRGWPHLRSVVIGHSVTVIEKHAFEGCARLRSVVFGRSVTIIDENAFARCYSLDPVTLPPSLIKLWGAFRYCSSLTSVEIPPSVTSLSGSFTYCSSLTSVRIPASVTGIRDVPFEGCSRLRAIHVDDDNPAYSSVEGVVFSKDKTRLVVYPAGRAGAYEIPSTVTRVGYGAFRGCRLTSVTAPRSVTVIGAWAFGYCRRLKSVTLGDSVRDIGDWAFSGCDDLRSITVYSTRPPGTSFYAGDSRSKITLRVPASAVEAYKRDDAWRGFKKITSI